MEPGSAGCGGRMRGNAQKVNQEVWMGDEEEPLPRPAKQGHEVPGEDVQSPSLKIFRTQ